MELVLCFNERINFSESLLNERDDFNRKGWSESFKAACVFDDEMRVLKVISRFLTAELTLNKSASTSPKSVASVEKELDILRLFSKYLRNVDEFKDRSDEYALIHTGEFHLIRYFTHLRDEKNLKSTTIRNYDALIKSFYDYLELHDLIENNPYLDGYLSGSAKTPNVVAASLDEVSILISCTNLERERLVIQFLYDSGLRRSELPRVTLADLSQAASRTYDSVKKDDDVFMHDDYVALKVRGSKSHIQSEFKSRITRISYPTLNRIKKYHASPLYKKHIRKYADHDSTPAFLNAYGEAYTKEAISELLKKLSRRARKKGLLTKSIAPHMLRHGFAYAVLSSSDAGTTYLDRLVQVQLMLGHQKIETTQETYTKVPIEIYKYLVTSDGKELTRALLMERLWKKTELRIGVRDTK